MHFNQINRVMGVNSKKVSNHFCLSLNYLNSHRAFTLVEIMVAMLIMVAAIVPVTALMTNNAKETNVSEAYSAMMHQSTRILDTLLERVRYADIISAARLQGGLASDTATTEATLVNLLDIKDSTNTAAPGTAVFDQELRFDGPGLAAGKTWQYAEPSRQFEPIIYELKIRQIDKTFRYLLNVGIKNPVNAIGEIPDFDTPNDAAATPPDQKKVGSVPLSGKLMKITLLVGWGTPRPGIARTYQNNYSLVTFKAKLED
ncbi:MAG: hypothetical protein BWY32_01602 [bacterium ADurb.Bin243]|nr:MAG: hypothetical protein BWY32_01602 [bacterium ADurb.Bin243]HOD39489.1 prepilin-type N-terminal cleavage/methylation domain-containing protein [Candidatus Wallbacteria bacterium]